MESSQTYFILKITHDPDETIDQVRARVYHALATELSETDFDLDEGAA